MRSSIPIFVAFLTAAVTSTVAAPTPGGSESLQDLDVRLCCCSCWDLETYYIPITGQRFQLQRRSFGRFPVYPSNLSLLTRTFSLTNRPLVKKKTLRPLKPARDIRAVTITGKAEKEKAKKKITTTTTCPANSVRVRTRLRQAAARSETRDGIRWVRNYWADTTNSSSNITCYQKNQSHHLFMNKIWALQGKKLFRRPNLNVLEINPVLTVFNGPMKRK